MMRRFFCLPYEERGLGLFLSLAITLSLGILRFLGVSVYLHVVAGRHAIKFFKTV